MALLVFLSPLLNFSLLSLRSHLALVLLVTLTWAFLAAYERYRIRHHRHHRPRPTPGRVPT